MKTGPTPRLHRRGRAAAAQVPCPHCGYPYSRQIQTQATEQGYRRRRECLRAAGGTVSCERSFTTYEVLSRDLTLVRKVRELILAETKKGA